MEIWRLEEREQSPPEGFSGKVLSLLLPSCMEASLGPADLKFWVFLCLLIDTEQFLVRSLPGVFISCRDCCDSLRLVPSVVVFYLTYLNSS